MPSHATCRVVRDTEDIEQIADKLQSSKWLNAAMKRVPHLDRVIRAINPAADMTEFSIPGTGGKKVRLGALLKRLTIAHQVMIEERLTAVNNALAHIANNRLEKLFTVDEDRMIHLEDLSGARVKVAEGDFLETANPSATWKLTKAQADIHEYMTNLWQNMVDDFKKHGGEGISNDELKFPRRVEGIIDSAGNLRTKEAGSTGRGSYALGAQPASAKSRAGKAAWEVKDPVTGQVNYHDNSVDARADRAAINAANKGTGQRATMQRVSLGEYTQAEMQDKGYRYRPANEAIAVAAQEMAKRVADAQYLEWVKKQKFVRTKAQLLGKGTQTGVYPVQDAAKFGGPQGQEINVSTFDSLPGLTGHYAPSQIARYVEEIVARPARVEIPILSKVSNETRGFKAAFDVSFGGLQLLGAIATDLGNLTRVPQGKAPSHIFLSSMHQGLQALLKPEQFAHYIEANKGVIDRWSAYLGGLHNSELFEGSNTALAARVPLGVGTAFRHTSSAWEAALDAAKIEMAKSFEDVFAKELKADPYGTKEALGSWIRNSLGMQSSQRLGVSPRTRAIEGILAFSPRYLRSTIALAGAVLKSGVERDVALRSFGAMALAGYVVYSAAAAVTGQDADFHVTHGRRFLALKMGDNYIGVGGGIRALAQLAGGIADTAKHNPEDLVAADFDNPLLNFWRGRSAPVVSSAIDIFTGADFNNRPVDVMSPEGWLHILQDKGGPFFLTAGLEAKGGLFTRAGASLAAGTGLSTSPMSQRTIYDNYLKEIRLANGEQRFPDGAQTQNSATNHFSQFVQSDKRAATLKAAYEQSRREAAGKTPKIQALIDDRQTRLQAAETQFQKTHDYRTYRAQVNEIRGASREAFKFLALDTAPGTEDKKLVNSWYSTYDDPSAVDPITGGINSDGLDQLQAAWKKAHPGAWEELIQPNEEAGATPMETQLRSDRAKISAAGWWDTDDQAWAKLKEMGGSELGLGKYKTIAAYALARHQVLTQQARAAGYPDPELAADVLLGTDKVLSAFSKVRSQLRLQLQAKRPDIVPILARWGYSSTSADEYGLATAG